MQINMNGNRINIDGKVFVGKNVRIVGNKVIIDGVEQEGSLLGDVNITIEGDVERVENYCGTVKANQAGTISTTSGDVECGNVSGSISTMSGNVKCLSVGGSVSTMSGDIDKAFI